MEIESTSSAWKAEVLPLNYTHIWCRPQKSNLQRVDYKSTALPIELRRHMAGPENFGISTSELTVQRSASELRTNMVENLSNALNESKTRLLQSRPPL